MLTKKAKAAAELMAEQIAELLKQCEKVAKDYEKKDREYYKARALFNAWQWFNRWDYQEQEPEETKKAEETHKTNPREWVRVVDRLADEQERARVSYFVARVNFQNFANYTAEKVAEIVRPYWRIVYPCGGFKNLGEAVSPTYKDADKHTAHALRVCFSVFSESIRAQGVEDPASFVRVSVGVYCGAPVGVSGHIEGIKMGDNLGDEPRDIKEPHRLTVAEFLRVDKRLEQINAQARATLDKLTKEARELVRGSGLYGFADFLAGYHLTISK